MRKLDGLELLALTLLALRKEQRESAVPEEFDDLAHVVRDIKLDATEALRSLLEDQGIEWNGEENLTVSVLRALAEECRFRMAARELERKIVALGTAKAALANRKIAGVGNLRRAAEVVESMSVPKLESKDDRTIPEKQ